MSKTLLVGFMVATATVGCAKPAPDTAADVAAINAVREREIAAFSGGQPDSLVAVMTADVVFLPPNEPRLDGATALRGWAANMANSVSVQGRYTGSDVQVAGDWAIDSYTGELTITPKAGGPSTQERFRGIHVLRRQSDGSWRIAQDIWNADAPAAVPAAPTSNR